MSTSRVCRSGPMTTACRSTACSSVRPVGAWTASTSVARPRASAPRSTSTRRRSRFRTGSRSPRLPATVSWRSRPRSSQRRNDGSPSPSGGTRTFGCPMFPGVSGCSTCRHDGTPALDPFGIPTGDDAAEPAERAPLGRRTFDDLYALGRQRRLSFEAEDGPAIELRCDSAYPYAQVWVPARQDLRRSRTDGRPDQRPGHRLGAAGRARRLVLGAVRARAHVSSSRRSSAMIRPAASISARWENACGKLPRW